MNINNPKILTVTDGSQGMISQTRGLAYELSNDINEMVIDVIFPWNILQPGILPPYKWIFKKNISLNKIPEILISCGRKSVYLSIYLKKKYPKLINIHIQNPKISSKNFSLIVAPNHDKFEGNNIINSIGALHNFKIKNYIKADVNQNKKKLVSCIIGGENNHYLFSKIEAKILCKKIKQLKINNPNIQVLVITSRRTTDEIKNLLVNELKSIAKIWIGEGENPYEFSLYNSDFFIISSDSTSMISEASISGKPIYVFKLPFKRRSLRFIRFHREFEELNITRDLLSTNNLENWSYNKLCESERIAGIIKERIIQGIDDSK